MQNKWGKNYFKNWVEVRFEPRTSGFKDQCSIRWTTEADDMLALHYLLGATNLLVNLYVSNYFYNRNIDKS